MKILYQDSEIIVCIKPAGVMSTDEAGGMPDLIREVAGKDAKVYTVHRLDSVVSGLMVYAFTSSAASELSRQIEADTFKKSYYAVVEGKPDPAQGKLTDYLRRNTRERKTYVVKQPGKGAEDAALLYRTVKRIKQLSLVRIELITGRTHQIRAQFSSRRLPLFGDRKYGSTHGDAKIALWSCSLSFAHPVTGKSMKFQALPPSREPWDQFPGYHEAYETSDVLREFKRSAQLADCVYARECDICAYQGLDYARQLEKKQKMAGRWLKNYGEIKEILPMDAPAHYKNKAVRTWAVSKKGKILSGIPGKAKHSLVPVSHCMIENEKLEQIVADVRRLMHDCHMVPYDPIEKTGWLKRVVVRASRDREDILLILVAASEDFPDKAAFVQGICEKQPQVKGILLNIHNTVSPAVFGKDEQVLWGSEWIADTLCGKHFEIGSKTYFPENIVQTEKLYGMAISYAKLTGHERVLQPYCGSGLLGLIAAQDAEKVLCVDRNEDMIREGMGHAHRNQIGNMKWTCSEPLSYIEALARSHDRIHVVLLDMMRGRLPKGTMKQLIHLASDRIICLMDDLEILAEELEVLKGTAYQVKQIQPVDIEPYTKKTTCIVVIENSSTPRRT